MRTSARASFGSAINLFVAIFSRRDTLQTHVSGSHKYMSVCRVLQLLIGSCGVVLFALAFSDPVFRDAEGFLRGTICLPVAVGVALIVLGWGLAGKLKRFACWLALALIGQAVALQMIDAGTLIHYQHYKPSIRLLSEHPLLLTCLTLQAILVISGFRTHWSTVSTWITNRFKIWRLLGIALLVFLSSATVSRETSVYVAELLFAGFVQMVNLANILLMVLALPDDTLLSLKDRFDNIVGPREERSRGSGGVDRFVLVCSLWVIILAALLACFSYERHPHLADEVGYLYHARYFAAGMLAMPGPPAPEAFNIDLMNYEADKWYSPVSPGWPAILMAGIVLGAPWLVNPLLAGFNVLLAYVLLWELYDRRSARLAVLLMCISPWHVFMAMNFMTHTLTLTCALAAAVAIARARKTGRPVWGWLGGIAAGMVSLIRPLDGLVVAGLLGLSAIGIGAIRLNVSAIVGVVLGSMTVGGMGLFYNSALTGHPTIFPLTAYLDKYYGPNRNAFGFGPERGLGWAIDPYPGHSPIESIINANLNISSVNVELFGWSTGSLAFIALILFSGAMRRSDYLMIAVIAAIVGTHSLYWFSGGPDFGARYWYLVLVPCIALTVSGIRFLENAFHGTTANSTRTRVLAAVLSMCILTILNYFPWRAIDKYFHYLSMRPDIRQLASEHGFGRSLVLIRGERHPDYASAAIYNPLDLHSDSTIYAWDRNPEVRAQVAKAYSDRPVWLVDGPTVTKGPFRLIAGPLSADQLLSTR